MTASGTTYASLPELKAYRGIVDSDSDLLLAKVLATASRQIDQKCDRRFWLDDEPTQRVFDVAGRSTSDQRLLVDDIGAAANLVVETRPLGGGVWAEVAAVEAAPLNALAVGRPITEMVSTGACWRGQVRITARWGWPSVPEEVSLATVMLAARLYQRKSSPQGVVASADFGALRVSRWDPDVEALLAPYILTAVG